MTAPSGYIVSGDAKSIKWDKVESGLFHNSRITHPKEGALCKSSEKCWQEALVILCDHGGDFAMALKNPVTTYLLRLVIIKPGELKPGIRGEISANSATKKVCKPLMNHGIPWGRCVETREWNVSAIPEMFLRDPFGEKLSPTALGCRK